jgi:hypothetical protein
MTCALLILYRLELENTYSATALHAAELPLGPKLSQAFFLMITELPSFIWWAASLRMSHG